jgi:predicted RNA-binding protein associated with RNAse of E/G family
MWGNLAVDIDLYVDIVCPPQWRTPSQLRLVDLDLDVIRRRDGTVLIDDEDEFNEHAVSLGYPPQVAQSARDAADAIYEEVDAGVRIFASPPTRWVEAAESLVPAGIADGKRRSDARLQ